MDNVQSDLESKGYSLHESLSHLDLQVFLQKYLRKKNPVIVFFMLFTVFCLAWVVKCFLTHETSFMDTLADVGLGFAAFLLWILPHEAIHALTYKLQGAPHVAIRANPRKLIFYAIADGFVVNTRQFTVLALAPFVVISALHLFIAFFLSSEAAQSFLAGSLLMHTSGCSGDFALLSYFYEYRNMDPLTYDNAEEKMSYFYHRRQPVKG